jgi:hypothetical protein
MKFTLKHLNESGLQLQIDDVVIDISTFSASEFLRAPAGCEISVTIEGDTHMRKHYNIKWDTFVEFIKSQKPGGDSYFERIESFTKEIK